MWFLAEICYYDFPRNRILIINLISKNFRGNFYDDEIYRDDSYLRSNEEI